LVVSPSQGAFQRGYSKEGISMEEALNEILIVDEAAELLGIPRSTATNRANWARFRRGKSAGIGGFIVLPSSIGSQAKTIGMKKR
jgi:hypothetical protein